MSKLFSAIDVDGIEAAAAMQEILKYGACLIGFAVLSLISGVMAGKYAAIASCGFASNLRHDLFYKVQKYSFANVD